MDKRATLSLVLVALAFGVGGVVAFGVGAETSRPTDIAAPTPSSTRVLADVATPAELRLWNDRGCVTCHGVDAHGAQFGPDLSKVLPLYLAKYGDAAAAKSAIVAYLVDPKNSPKLRQDGARFPNPMPPIEAMFGGKREDADVLARMLLRLVE